jgi:hypothetical protein
MGPIDAYVPHVGDKVSATGQNGSFEVIKLYERGHTADLRLIGAAFGLLSVPGPHYRLLRRAGARMKARQRTDGNVVGPTSDVAIW